MVHVDVLTPNSILQRFKSEYCLKQYSFEVQNAKIGRKVDRESGVQSPSCANQQGITVESGDIGSSESLGAHGGCRRIQ